MSHTITALYDSRADAEAARASLVAAHIGADNIQIHDNSMIGEGHSSSQELGLWASIKNAFLPDEDRYSYEEGVRRGGFLLTVDVDPDQVDEATRLLEDGASVDMDERVADWKTQGWQQPTSTAAATAASPSAYEEAKRVASGTGREERLDIVEEQLVVGKREVARGGVRVRSYVTERPVHEQIRLREENVSVQRSPVDRAVTDGDAVFKERSFSVTETAEEAVVGKQARVVEEVVVRKSSQERVEDINETVRRTNVEVENVSGAGTGGSHATNMGSQTGKSPLTKP